MFIKTLTVGKLNSYIKKIMDSDFILKNIYVKGEISNLKIHSSGHIYFSLKDSEGKISCVMFKDSAEGLTFQPENGMKVLATGRVSVYIKDGNYQLYCSEMQIEGLGELHIAFENLKKKLYEKGMFEEDNKKPLPKYPKKIGVITSPTGAAVRDIINVCKRRNTKMDILIYPTLVQGDAASLGIINALKYLDEREDIEAIIIARGGGSLEELWAFNDEKLAEAVYKCKTPVVSGVGHETDFTIIDFVSDRRAPTPSAAAEILVPKLEDMVKEISYYGEYLFSYMEKFIDISYNKINSLRSVLEVNSPLNRIVNEYRILDNYKNTMESIIKNRLYEEKSKLNEYKIILESNNPLNSLSKGFSIIYDDKYNIIKTKEDIIKNDIINIRLRNGEVRLKIQVLEESNG
ncbi:exodeoxyribonuclease VII large subunit [Haloimpatiens lingqiaonensis]|uniref:exodeoxyribonuclease VII large subunit n=1 Tax=Haloimpatiens lingqiaonensis TaxID=1380675 RepID=UPI0010FDE0C3|nr:exodeoxyribonuclease VII large subunit [Haloimpatiens lingqiaonensis]